MTLYKFSVGAVLAVAMVGVLGVSALVFSSRDFQFGVAQVAPTTNGRVDFAELDRVEAEIAAIREASEPTRQELNEVQGRLDALDRAEPVAVEHGVADHEHTRLGQAFFRDGLVHWSSSLCGG